jgi:hypothetical protein
MRSTRGKPLHKYGEVAILPRHLSASHQGDAKSAAQEMVRRA